MSFPEEQVINAGVGAGGGLVVSLLVFYSDNPFEFCFSVKIVFENNENKQKEAEVGPFK